jgi:hypothetical protein
VLGEPKRTFKPFQWLALHQVGHLTFRQIAEREPGYDGGGLDFSTITHALDETARLIGLTRRALRPRHA